MKVKARVELTYEGKKLKKGDVFEIKDEHYSPMMCGNYIDGHKEPKRPSEKSIEPAPSKAEKELVKK